MKSNTGHRNDQGRVAEEGEEVCGEQLGAMENARKRCQAPSTSKSLMATEDDPYKIDPLIALIDMDCFYVQVELRLEPEWRGKPAIVVQYKTRHKGGGIIALSYEARERGVKRFHHADDAREVCPEVKVFVVPELHGKADLTRYRDAGAEVIRVMKKHFHCVERASVDEAFVDLTKEVKQLLPRYLSKELKLTPEALGSTCIAESHSVEAWLDQLYLKLEEDPEAFVASSVQLNNFALAIGAVLVNDLRQDIINVTEFHCSGGISYSKTLSKLACGLNKPRKQTVLPGNAVGPLFNKTNIIDVRMLGGKLGRSIIENLCISTMGELCKVEVPKLRQYFSEETARWLASLAVGIDNEPVQERDLPKSIGCSKNFLGKEALSTREQVKKWMEHFVSELSVRLKKDQAENNRSASLLTVSITYVKDPFKIKSGQSCSRCAPMTSYDNEAMVYDAFMVADRLLTSLGYRNGRYHYAVINLGISASKMRDGGFTASRIDSYFRGQKKKEVDDSQIFPGNKYSELKVKGRDASKIQLGKAKEVRERKGSITKYLNQASPRKDAQGGQASHHQQQKVRTEHMESKSDTETRLGQLLQATRSQRMGKVRRLFPARFTDEGGTRLGGRQRRRVPQ
ncbi:hypothetical protein RvY_16985-2 [Ramazzottius varieornatus]|uniref:DNA polymerase eta n=1 Tax=Ramazzottius varieornatus TaxID=947166 RepID=A0A1D1W0I0_RAMVA|nr:hypothetical protein RvY_16985-2 [Ramazzottius varieornatus]